MIGAQQQTDEYVYTYIHIVIHTYIHTMEYDSVIKKNEIISLAGKWMELEIIMLSELNQTQKDKHNVLSHL
jgi:hypothetical protein